jgi:hypothetical protein
VSITLQSELQRIARRILLGRRGLKLADKLAIDGLENQCGMTAITLDFTAWCKSVNHPDRMQRPLWPINSYLRAAESRLNPTVRQADFDKPQADRFSPTFLPRGVSKQDQNRLQNTKTERF